MRRRSPNRTEEPFQMAPMIDMVFLLLVFFMTVSTLAKDARPDIALPESLTAVVPEEVPPRDIITVIPEGGDYGYFWNNRQAAEEELARLLEKAGEGAAAEQLLLRGPPDLPWSVWKAVIEKCRAAGITDLTFATHET